MIARRVSQQIASAASVLMYFLALGGPLLLALIPAQAVDPLAARLGCWLYRRDGPRPRQLRANLRVAMGPDAPKAEIASAAEDVFASYGRYMAEYFTMGWPDLWGRRRRLVSGDVSAFEAELARGHGIVLFGIHGGNWDFAAAECAQRYGAFHSAGELVEPAWLGRLTNLMRRRSGIDLYDARQAGRPLLRALKRGQVIGLVADRTVIGNAAEVTLCGRKARLPRGPVQLAIMAGAPLIPTVMERRADGAVHVEFLPPIDLSDLRRQRADIDVGVQRMADGLTAMIRRGYRSWYALQPIWTDDGAPGLGPG